MLADIGKTRSDWEVYVREFRVYRDKFIAHLDEEPTMHIPVLNVAESAIRYLYDTLLLENTNTHFQGLPVDLRDYQKQCFSAAQSVYQNA